MYAPIGDLTCFKAYDIRGKLGDELNTDIAYRIGRAITQQLDAKKLVVGGDVRLSSKPLKSALARGIMDSGADVVDLGVTGTEEIYFAAFYLDVDGGIEVTASHNPIDYNGMKIVQRGANPLAEESLQQIKKLAQSGNFECSNVKGSCFELTLLNEYVDHLLKFIDPSSIAPTKIVVNSGNGASGRVIDAIQSRLEQIAVGVEFIKIHHEPDGTFPNGIPNPLLPENRDSTAQAVIECQADFGIAWDGDFDRCFFFDDKGKFVEGYYMVGLLAQAFLSKNPGEKIIYDPRLTWNTIDIVRSGGGVPVLSRTGHAFIKQSMRKENAVYGGEMSAHHYFRDFGYCDSGMVPWLLILEIVSKQGKPLSQLVEDRVSAFPCSGELNYTVKSCEDAIEHVRDHFEFSPDHKIHLLDTTDGISMEFDNWRFSLRASNTEPLLRLNVETRMDNELVGRQVKTIEKLLGVS